MHFVTSLTIRENSSGEGADRPFKSNRWFVMYNIMTAESSLPEEIDYNNNKYKVISWAETDTSIVQEQQQRSNKNPIFLPSIYHRGLRVRRTRVLCIFVLLITLCHRARSSLNIPPE